jgi:hypothetical protein
MTGATVISADELGRGRIADCCSAPVTGVLVPCPYLGSSHANYLNLSNVLKPLLVYFCNHPLYIHATITVSGGSATYGR